ncbi:MAG: alpha-ketoglutarate-dependent dioxygenase AlkB [Polyangiales bacterium]
MLHDQLSLLGRDDAPLLDEAFGTLQRRELAHGAWIDYAPGWLRGHTALYDALVRTTAFRALEERMYDRTVQVPRLIASLPDDGPGHPVIDAMGSVLCQRYRCAFTRVSLALYRDGRDSVAYHGDRVARDLPEALVATVSLGTPRRFLLRVRGAERTGREPSIAYKLGWGDLLVMGGSCQRTWQHAIPKVAAAGPRIAIMFRPDFRAPGVSPSE